MKNSNYLDSLTSLRGLAAMLVVISHLDTYGFLWKHFWAIGEVGVAIFFCLSGFLMGYLYLERKLDYNETLKYSIARFFRIAPPYLITVVFCYFMYSYFDPHFPFEINNSNIIRHLLFSGNVEVFWSIPPEVQFYVVFLLIWFLASCFGVSSYVFIFCIVMFFVIYMFRDSFPKLSFFYYFAYFLIGMLFGVLRRKDIHIPFIVLFQILAILFAFAYLWRLKIYGGAETAVDFWNDPYNFIWSGILIYIMSFRSHFTRIFLDHRLLVKSGEWSFSLYLTHVFVLYYCEKVFGGYDGIIGILLSVLAVIICLAFSFLFHVLIEKHFAESLKSRMTKLLVK
ncbi:MAG: acyltransferase [Thalassolituus sp.]|jgi:peptidoglycan/LPS O-acetylase OafA/YrhL